MRTTRRRVVKSLLVAPWALTPWTAFATTPAKGSALRLIDLPLLEGGAFKAAEAEGRVLMIYWWASWCPFCREMSPEVEKLWRAQRGRGLIVLGVTIDRTAEAALSHRRKYGYTFPSAIYGAGMDRVWPRPRTVPTTWVRDRQGKIAMAATGQLFPEDVADIANFL